ncbi:unnamed protein product [Peronospora belbahrii]|uniref:Uncharacterized protein n=1 Tax=Peronospora belbahrii TaxID=622444 RepID=A0ABN8CMA4_9STRA|nr:unnamed protein product [Peronospora belbahrii]
MNCTTSLRVVEVPSRIRNSRQIIKITGMGLVWEQPVVHKKYVKSVSWLVLLDRPVVMDKLLEHSPTRPVFFHQIYHGEYTTRIDLFLKDEAAKSSGQKTQACISQVIRPGFTKYYRYHDENKLDCEFSKMQFCCEHVLQIEKNKLCKEI